MYARSLLFLAVMFFCQMAVAVHFQSDSLSEVEEEHYLEEKMPLTTPFSEARWKAAKEGTEYVPEEEVKPQKTTETKPFNFNIFPDLSSLKYVLIGFTIVAIIVLLIYNFRNSLFPLSSSKPQNRFDVLVPEDLDDQELLLQDLQKLLAEALASKEYALAIRLLYLSTLQQLIKHRFVVWKKELPNRHILRQIKVDSVYQNTYPIFKGYEQVWYGKKQVQELDFEQINRLYALFLESITAKS